MAFTYGFYNSKNKDRRYNADQMSQLFDGILNDGVFNKVGELMMVVPGTGLQVLVKSGRAWFNSTWSYNDAAYPLNLSTPDVAVKRIDAVVLEVDHTETVRANRLLVVKGIASSNPEKPTLTNTDLIHQHPLAYVTLNPGAESISSGDIEIMVGKDECPFVTGILETASLEDLFASWDEQFTTWFDDIKSQLEGDVATNLLNEINKRVKIADKASTSEVSAGTNDDKWVTPKGVAAVAGKVKDGTSGSLISIRSMFDRITSSVCSLETPMTGLTNNKYYCQTNNYIWGVANVGDPNYASSHDLVLERWSMSTGNLTRSVVTVLNETSSYTFASYPDKLKYVTSINNVGFSYSSDSNTNSIIDSDRLCALHYTKSSAKCPFITTSYYGYIRSGTLYYGNRGTKYPLASESSMKTINVSAFNGGYEICGIRGNVIYFLSKISDYEYHIHKADLSSATVKNSIRVFSTTSKSALSGYAASFKPICFNGQYAFILAKATLNKTTKYGSMVLAFDMTNETSNWDSITNFISVAGEYDPIYIGNNYFMMGYISDEFTANSNLYSFSLTNPFSISKSGLKYYHEGRVTLQNFSSPLGTSEYVSQYFTVNIPNTSAVLLLYGGIVDTKTSEIFPIPYYYYGTTNRYYPVPYFGTNRTNTNVLFCYSGRGAQVDSKNYVTTIGGNLVFVMTKV